MLELTNCPAHDERVSLNTICVFKLTNR